MATNKVSDREFIRRELRKEEDILFFDFINDEEYIPREADDIIPGDIFDNIEFEFQQILDNSFSFLTKNFEFIYEVILIFKRVNYSLLANTLFCYKIIDIQKKPNYTVSSIFNYDLFIKLFKEENGTEYESFIKSYISTSLFSKFVEDSFYLFYRIYIRNMEIEKSDSTHKFLKNMINAYKAMPSSKTKRKTFFEHTPFLVLSLLDLHKKETEEFAIFIKQLKVKEFQLENYFEYYHDQIREKKNSFINSDRKYRLFDSSFDSSLGNTTILSNRSFNGTGVSIGKYYFKSIKEHKLINLLNKDLSEAQVELKEILDIFK